MPCVPASIAMDQRWQRRRLGLGTFVLRFAAAARVGGSTVFLTPLWSGISA